MLLPVVEPSVSAGFAGCIVEAIVVADKRIRCMICMQKRNG